MMYKILHLRRRRALSYGWMFGETPKLQMIFCDILFSILCFVFVTKGNAILLVIRLVECSSSHEYVHKI